MALPTGCQAVNIGCGSTFAPGWINIDNSPNARLSEYPTLRRFLWKVHLLSDRHYAVQWPKSLIIHDLRKRLPFDDSSIDYVYASHVLEHLSVDDAQRLMTDIYRVLKSGGAARIVVPDLALGARRYLDALQVDSSDSQAATRFLNWMQLSRPGSRDPHLWMYDVPSLAAALTAAGFHKVVVCKYKHGRVPDCDILDNRPDDSLHMEAEKP